MKEWIDSQVRKNYVLGGFNDVNFKSRTALSTPPEAGQRQLLMECLVHFMTTKIIHTISRFLEN
jgi:hypothetical protein